MPKPCLRSNVGTHDLRMIDGWTGVTGGKSSLLVMVNVGYCVVRRPGRVLAASFLLTTLLHSGRKAIDEAQFRFDEFLCGPTLRATRQVVKPADRRVVSKLS